MKRERIEETLDAALDRHRDRAIRLVSARVRAEIAEWQARFPRRTVRFLDAMGSVCIWIDDRQEMEIGIRDKRLERIVAPLRSLVEWYCDTADKHGIGIADVEVGPA